SKVWQSVRKIAAGRQASQSICYGFQLLSRRTSGVIMNSTPRQLAVVTGASVGIGLELARLCAEQNFDLIIAADEPLIENAARELSQRGISCTPVQCDLATTEGVE